MHIHGFLLVPTVFLLGCGGPGASGEAETTSDAAGVTSEDAAAMLDAFEDLADDASFQTSDSPTASMQDSVHGDYNELSAEEQYVILRKGTERGGTGALLGNKSEGTYICRQCNAALFTSEHKFESHCGWPSFDDEIEGAVLRRAERDGSGRMEIVCRNCEGHLGHEFVGEGMTDKDVRHCVNSVSMGFVRVGEELPGRIER